MNAIIYLSIVPLLVFMFKNDHEVSGVYMRYSVGAFVKLNTSFVRIYCPYRNHSNSN